MTLTKTQRVRAFLSRQRLALTIAVVAVLASSGTAAAVSYLVLGGVNSAGATTTLKSGVNNPVLQLTNTNAAGGTSARGLAITVPAGRAPLTVNSSAGKATNLNADKLDGSDASAFARGAGVTELANRIVLGDGQTDVLLTHPNLGTLRANCLGAGSSLAQIYWTNTGTSVMDTWFNATADARYRGVWAGPGSGREVARYNASDQLLSADSLIVGKGINPGARSTATVTLAAFRSAAGASCSFQASATLWSAP